jgi:hypothetical protein
MAVYEHGRIAKLADALTAACVDPKTIDKIMAGGELIKKAAKPEKKAEWLSEAMSRMDALLDEPNRYAVREACACCLGGKRLEISKGIGKTYKDLTEAIEAANKARFVFGHSVALQDDGRILVSFEPDGKDSYRCVCLPKAKLPVSITYCYCCAGHVKHHLQTALGRKLSCTVRSSALESGGKSPCSFLFSVEE